MSAEPFHSDLERLLAEQSADAMVFADREGRIRYWNEAAAQTLGFSADQALGQRLDIIIPERLRASHWQGFDQAIATGQTKNSGAAQPTKALCADGSTIIIEVSFVLIRDEAGEVIGSLATARDITERFKKAREQRRRLRELEGGRR